MVEKKNCTLVIKVENFNQADAIALIKMFEYMQYLGQAGSSRTCSFYADGDGSFHPKISTACDIELPKVDDPKIGVKDNGAFSIDSDEIAWKIYHD